MTSDLSDDLFFGGRLRLLQPKRGHRVGSDAALLAAAARSRMGHGAAVADLGSGVGAVGLVLAACGAATAALIEIDGRLAELAAGNADRNDLLGRVKVVEADVAVVATGRGPPEPQAHSIDLVVANPPFDDAARFRASPEKALAHAEGEGAVEIWVRAAARLARPGGSLAMIHRPEALPRLLAALGGRFGDVRVRPVHPAVDAPATRILLAARQGRRGALALLPPLVLHEKDGSFTAEAQAAQRGDAAIPME